MKQYKYNYDRDYFKHINTEEKAYWLGFIAADGSIKTNTYEIYIELQIKDIEHLKQFKNALNSDLPIRETKHGKACRIIISCKYMGLQLCSYGIIPHKTEKGLNIKWNLIPKKYHRDFIRGYFDGNGWITKDISALGFCGGEQIVKDIAKHFDFHFCFQDKKTWCQIETGKKINIDTAIQYMYYDGCICLKRKKEIIDRTRLIAGTSS